MTVYDEIIEYLELNDGYDKEEIITDAIDKIKALKAYSADEIGLSWSDEGRTLMVLDDFATQFYDEIIKGVCNVLRSFQK